MKEKQTLHYINLLKCFAVLLVLNSHLDRIYPTSALATGGALGNTLFFLVSGYTWFGGAFKEHFAPWYARKLVRIYVPTIALGILYIVLFGFETDSVLKSAFSVFVYPHWAWFCSSLLIYAVFYYFICHRKESFAVGIVALCSVVYALWYVFALDTQKYSVESISRAGLCRPMFYAVCMLCGLIYRRYELRTKSSKGNVGIWWIAAGGLFVLFYANKYLMDRMEIFMRLQFINQLLTLACSICAFRAAQLSENVLAKLDQKCKVVGVLAAYSWEVYLTQILLLPLCERFAFPLNFVLTVASIAICSFALKKGNEPIQKWMLRAKLFAKNK